MFGLHYLDWLIIGAYFGSLVVIGVIASRRIQSEEDFFLAGRRLGRLLLVAMNFGMSTSSDTAVAAARESFRMGLAGIWIHLHVLFVTPFYWFTHLWLRRLRVVSMAEIFRLRYESRFLERLYVVYGMISVMALIALGMVAFQKTMEVTVPKPEARLSTEERRHIENFQRLSFLEQKMGVDPLTPDEWMDYEKLHWLRQQGEVRSVIPAVPPALLLGAVAIVVMVYSAAGGVLAAALTDLVQGALLIVLSGLLLVAGLIEIGGFRALHDNVPEGFFQLFSTGVTNEYSWYYVAAVTLLVLNQVVVSPEQPQVIGSANNEENARVGGVSGVFLKRLAVVCWGFTGLVGYGLFRFSVSDPDLLWGYMTRELLGPGLIGLMLVCLLAALMSSADIFIIAAGALFTRNVYEPLFPGRSQREYVWVGRITGVVLLVGATLIALKMQDLLRIIRFFWSLGVMFGPLYWMAILWRRTSTKAAVAAALYSFFFTVCAGYFAAEIPWTARHPCLTQLTVPAAAEGESAAFIPAVPIFFEEVVQEDPDEPLSRLGRQHFRTSLLLPAALGADLSRWSKGTLIATGYLLDVLIPFLLLLTVSLFSRMNSTGALNEFYSRLHTPVRGDPAEDERRLAEARENPDRIEQRKLFPFTYWEVEKPSRRDLIGFAIAWGVAGAVIVLVLVMALIGRP